EHAVRAPRERTDHGDVVVAIREPQPAAQDDLRLGAEDRTGGVPYLNGRAGPRALRRELEAAAIGAEARHGEEERAGHEEDDRRRNGRKRTLLFSLDRHGVRGGEDDALTRRPACQEARQRIGGRLRCREVARDLTEVANEANGIPAARAACEVRGHAFASFAREFGIRVTAEPFEARVSQKTDHAELLNRSLKILRALCSLLADPCLPIRMSLPISSCV